MLERILKHKQRSTQLHFRDDGQFEIRKLDILDGFLVEKEKDAVIKAWLMLFKLQKRFLGYKRIPSDMITVSYDRDIVLDLFHQADDKDKPEKGGDLKKAFVKKIAEAKCYRHEHSKKPRTLMDKMIMFFGAAIVLEVLIIGMQAAMKGAV